MSLSSRLSTRPTDTRTETSNQSASRRQSLASRHCAAPTGPNRHPHTHHSRSTNGTARHARHVTSRHDTTEDLFCRLPFPPPPPPGRARARRSQPSSTSPHKKVCRATFIFFPFWPGKFRVLFPISPPTKPSPAWLQLRTIPNRVGPGLCKQGARLACVVGFVAVAVGSQRG